MVKLIAVGIPWSPAGAQMQTSRRPSFDLSISIQKCMTIVQNYNLRCHIEKELSTSCQDLL